MQLQCRELDDRRAYTLLEQWSFRNPNIVVQTLQKTESSSNENSKSICDTTHVKYMRWEIEYSYTRLSVETAPLHTNQMTGFSRSSRRRIRRSMSSTFRSNSVLLRHAETTICSSHRNPARSFPTCQERAGVTGDFQSVSNLSDLLQLSI